MGLKASARAQIPPFIVMEVMQAAVDRQAKGGDVLHLEVGQPSSSAPQGVIERARAALAGDRLGYTVSLGIPELRAAIARHYRRAYGVAVPEERIVVTTGSSGAFLLAFLSAFDVGDRVAMAHPSYPGYRNILAALGIQTVGMAASADTRFQPTVAMLDALGPDIDGLIVASPCNPAGTMMRAADLAAIASACHRRGIRLISDEIYHGITYGEPASTAFAFSPSSVIINSFSKYYSMTGWRLGWMIVPEDLARPIECLAQNLFISPPTLAQIAACAAFDCGAELDANVARYRANRALLLEELPKAGFARLAPVDGAFYIYADVGDLTDDSEHFCRRMLAETGVAATPGLDFDPERGRSFVRFSFAGATAEMEEAARRLRNWKR